ncbi:DUF4350 domain-containing protein [Halorubrum miltondacostae]|uniref:DUF4350 domain-containing protein n=1 Tax=Halorubrum miltondacostae TaxID=3076378 RepID=A0ABD5M0W2_9EURY
MIAGKQTGTILLVVALLASVVAVGGVAAQDGSSSDEIVVGETTIDAQFIGTVSDPGTITVTATNITGQPDTITFTIGGEPVATAAVSNGSAATMIDPTTLGVDPGTATVSVQEYTVTAPATVETVHEVRDLDAGFNLVSVPQPATLSAEDIGAINRWDPTTQTYGTVIDNEFDDVTALQNGLYVSGTTDAARLGYTFIDTVPRPGTAPIEPGWNFVSSNFAIDSAEAGDSRTLEADLINVDTSSIVAFRADFGQPLTASDSVGAFDAYWVFNGGDSSRDRAIITPSYDPQTRATTLGVEPTASLEFRDQVTTTSQDVTVKNVSANVNSAVVVTYEANGELVVAGVTSVAASDLNGDDVTVSVADGGGLSGEHTAHVIPTDRLSSQYAPGETVSDDTAAGVLAQASATISAPAEPDDPDADAAPVMLDSVSSLLNANSEPLANDSIIAVSAEPTATNADEDGNGDAVSYPAETDIPVVAIDGSVVGVTGPFVASDTDFSYGNEEVMLNIYDELLGGSGTIVHDEGHGQFYSLAANGGDDFQTFASYAESNGYTYKATSDITANLSSADAVVITSPSDAFSRSERDALAEFAANGGVVILHDQSDFNNFDATANHNEIASALNASFRFNDDQVVDPENNTGAQFVPVTENYNTEAFPTLFADRNGLGVDLNVNETYTVDVVGVADGDTVDVEFASGTVETVRIVGIDTPETGSTDERLQEYEGIDDGPALKTAGDNATAYAQEQLAGETVTLRFDENEGLRGNFGRLLGFIELADGSVYNEEVIEDGWARVYDSGFDQHDSYWELEQTARANNDGIWELSDPAATPETGDSEFSDVFMPEPVAVSGGEVAVSAESGEPLVAVDTAANVAVVGAPLIEEGFEAGEGGPGVAAYGNYPFLTNTIAAVSDADSGPVVIDNGHGQFASDAAVSAEDAAYYQRYLEGQSPGNESFIGFEASTNLTTEAGPDLLSEDGTPAARALIISAPTTELTAAERATVAAFADAGGAVILLGSAADQDAVSNFEPVLTELNANVGFTNETVTDEANSLTDDPAVFTTGNVTDAYADLFTPFTAENTTPTQPSDVGPVMLDSVSSLLNANGEPLTDDSVVAVSAESTATNSDTDGNGDAVSYPAETDIPVVAVDGSVVGVTGPFVASDTNFSYGNEEVMLNIYDELLGGSGTIVHDEGHGQFYTVAPNGGDDFQEFASYAEANGYTYEATTNVTANLSSADAVVITSPSEGYTQSERDALAEFAANGGVVILHDQSDFNNFDATANHNEIASALNASFRFNDDQVTDSKSNTGQEFVPVTSNYNTATFPALFDTRDGLGTTRSVNTTADVDVVDPLGGDALLPALTS